MIAIALLFFVADTSAVLAGYPNGGQTYRIVSDDCEIGWYLLIDGEYKESIEKFNKGIELNSSRPYCYYFRGAAQSQLGLYYEAIKDYSKAIELDPNDSRVYHNRGYAYYELKQYKTAIKDYSKVIELNPNYDYYAGAYHDRGVAYYYLKQYENAIKDYNKAIELNPNFSDAYYSRKLAQDELKSNDEQSVVMKQKTPGFDAGFAIAGILIIGYVFRRNKNLL